MAVIDEIRQRIDIADLIGTRTPLRKAGRTLKGLCPFHPEKTPSFVVYPDQWSYHCFGCGAHGSGIDFVMATQNVEFKDALAELAGRAGLSLAGLRKEADPEVEHVHQRLRAALEAANRFFYNLLLNSPSAAAARAYAEQRGLDKSTIDAFQLGYSPSGWSELREYLTGEGFTDQELIESGLLVQRDDGKLYDRFRDRLTFPIRDADGRLVGFGARTLGNAQPKYLNSPQTALFDKGAVPYGIDRAKQAIRQAGQAVVVEGYMDVIALHQRGIQNVVAAMGTSLTDRQIRGLKRFSSNIVLALDADAAGAEATLRGLEVARAALDHKVVPVPTWQGTVRYEQALNATIKVAVLPPGQDPDDVAKQGIDRWQALIEQARPVLDYLLETVAARVDPADPKAKAAAAERILPVIAEVRHPVEQAHYRQRLADLLGLSERDLVATQRQLDRRADDRARTTRSPGGPPTDRPSGQPPSDDGRPDADGTDEQPGGSPEVTRPGPLGPEYYCLALLLDAPELAPLVAELELGPEDFSDPAARTLFTLWQSGAGNIQPETLDSSLEPIYRKLIRFHVPDPGVASRQVALRDVVAKLRRSRWEALARSSPIAVDDDLSPEALAARLAQVTQYNQTLRALKDRHRSGRPT